MRILFYNHAAEISGAERSLLSIMHGARAAGHTVTLCAPPGALAESAACGHIALEPIAPLVLGYPRHPIALLRYLGRAAAPVAGLWRAIRRSRPDIVHANSIRGGLIAGAALRLVRPGPGLVVHMRDALRPTLAGRLVARIIGAEADAIVAISRYVAQEVRVPAGTVHVLHNAIDPCQYRFSPDKGSALRRRLGIPQEAPLLAVVGQISPWKGQHEAIVALAAVRKACPATHLLVAGSVKFLGAHCRYDNQEYYDALVARSQDPDVAGFVHLAGEVGDAGAIYSAADALLVPSWAEPFGRIVIEAMAARCPVIATAAGGVPEIMTHGVNGLLVAPRDPAALAGAALTLLRDAALRDALAHNAYEMVAERFSMADYTLHMQDIWTKTSTHGRK